MTHTRKIFCLLTPIVVALACLTFNVKRSRAARTTNRLASNRLATNRLASNKLAADKLSTTALSPNRFGANPATADLLATTDGRDVYAYLVNCALPDGTTIQATIQDAADTAPPATLYTCAGGVCTFPGGIGLAEYWIDHKLDPKGQRWVSACMFARVNAHNTAEPISARGPHDALMVTPDEAVQFPIQEGAFYGNLFTGDNTIDWNACRGEGQAQGEFDGLVDRDCAEPDPLDPTHTQCGFKYAGDCRDYSPTLPSPYACQHYDFDLGIYENCHDSESDGHWGTQPNREVITVYVTCSPDC
jgi:hypothetical protein